MTVSLERASNGWFVRAGCMVFVFTDTSHLINELSRYLHDPEKVMREYNEKYRRVDVEAGLLDSAAVGMAKENVYNPDSGYYRGLGREAQAPTQTSSRRDR